MARFFTYQFNCKMTRKKGEREWYQLRGLTFPTFLPYFCFFLKDPGPLHSKKRSGYMESCLASHSVGEPGRLSRTPDPDFFPSRISDPGSQIPGLGSRDQKGTGSRIMASKKGFLLFKGQVTF